MKKLNLCFAIVASLLMASTCDDGTVVGTGAAAGGATTTLGSVSMGIGTGAGFQASIIGFGIDVGMINLSAGGSTSMTVNFVLTDGTLFTDPVDVTFSSPCIAAGTATVTINPVTSANGQADGTYVATGCSTPGGDVVTATASVSGTALTATGTITVASATVGSIQFISATPDLIGLQGTGGLGIPETSTVIFRVIDSTGGPVAGTDVDFTLSTEVGGLDWNPKSATSAANGDVQTVVRSGTVAATVRVNAIITALGIGTQSSVLVVSTGLPDQDSFSWSVACANIEALGFDGVENDVTVRLSDRFQNPVPDGTAVSFTAEGGSIESSCQTQTNATQSGFCTVTWTSSDPRPVDGRVTVLAHAIGEESFADGNGNGIFDSATTDSFTDLGEQFRDDDESGFYDVGEFFLDFNLSGGYDNLTPPPAGDGLFNGLLCKPNPGSGECSTSETTGIGDSGVIIMSGSTACMMDNLGGGLACGAGSGGTLDLTTVNSVTFTVGDVNDQPMPAGTTVAFETDNGTIGSISEHVVLCTSANSALPYTFFVNGDGTSNMGGLGVLTVTTPGVGGGAGAISTYSITVDD